MARLSAHFLFAVLLTACSNSDTLDAAKPQCADFSGHFTGTSVLDSTACGGDVLDERIDLQIDQVDCQIEMLVEGSTLRGVANGDSVEQLGGLLELELGSFDVSQGSLTISQDALSGNLSLRSSTASPTCEVTIDFEGSRRVASNTNNSDHTPDVMALTPDARAVGYWALESTTCDSGTSENYVYILCPGGRIRGAGEFVTPGTTSTVTELVCGDFVTKRKTIDNCEDRVGCFDRTDVDYTSTLILSGQSSTQRSTFNFIMSPDGNGLAREGNCENGERGMMRFVRVVGEPADHDCVSEACPASGAGSSSPTTESCGTDCDCGQCWYCDESGNAPICRYGGQGDAGCFRGCSW